ncbi:MAG: phytanoyl-CoA dioxygenase family protein [Lentisphaeria bacterium]|nr:phytanoyl-CoA dioxygenase family protein [Lentisphaeria bacterium]NQZ70994.1 phytanoyl-CoA dioxygenase family protein [Lentisphaeria bacterium]
MSESRLDAFEKNGFYVYDKPVLSAELVSDVHDAMHMIMNGENDTGMPARLDFWKPEDDPAALVKIDNPQCASKAITKLLKSPEMGAAVAAVTGAEMVQIWTTQLLYKPPQSDDGDKVQGVGWHQDWTYWNTNWKEGADLFTAWVAISDVKEESGPMKFIARSHSWQKPGGGNFWGDNSAKDFEVPEGEEWNEVTATMPSGALSVHDCHTLHGSGPNESSQARYSFALHMRSEKSFPLPGDPEFSRSSRIDDMDLCPIIYGDRIESAFTPQD